MLKWIVGNLRCVRGYAPDSVQGELGRESVEGSGYEPVKWSWCDSVDVSKGAGASLWYKSVTVMLAMLSISTCGSGVMQFECVQVHRVPTGER